MGTVSPQRAKDGLVPDTFETFFKGNYREVERRVAAAGASPEVASDAAQEAFTRAYQRWWRLSRYQNPASWVQRVALNHRIDIERSANRQRHVVARLDVQTQALDAPSDVDADPRIDEALESLPPRQRAAVDAYYSEGLSAAETADRMGISSGAVRYHLNQARSSLRPQLSPESAPQEA